MAYCMLVDDEPLALRDLEFVVRRAGVAQELASFQDPAEALAWALDHEVDIAFLDIEMPGMNGIELALRLKKRSRRVHIVFVTSYECYAVDAFKVHATGYLLKPACMDDVRRELTFIYDEAPAPAGKLDVRMFGGFEVSVDGVPLAFKRSKSRELLALLIDARGMSMSAREIRALLWEDEPASASQASYYQSLVTDLRQALHAAGVPDALARTRGRLAIDPAYVDADSWRVLDGDPVALNKVSGPYLPAYGWAEGRFWS